jgi:hypothetical protein
VRAARVKFLLPQAAAKAAANKLGSCEFLCSWEAAKLSNFYFYSAAQLANCTKNLIFSCKNFVILTIVKTIDKFKILCYNIYRK